MAKRPACVGAADTAAATHLDVRDMIAGGEEPFDLIMRTAREIPAGGVLVIEAPFDPAPLRRVLGKQGFTDHAEEIGPDHWRVWFRRGERRPEEAAPAAPPAARIWREADGFHIDVRGLEPPQPMVAILRLLERADCTPAVTVHHEREPIYLYPELAERRWAYEPVPGEPGEVRLRLTRRAP